MSKPAPTIYLLFLILGLVLTLPFATCAGWCFYDGLVGFPAQRERALEFERIKQTYPDSYPTQWTATAKANGWSTQIPARPKQPHDITTQYLMGGACGGVAFGCLVVAVAFGVLLRRHARQAESAEHAEENGC